MPAPIVVEVYAPQPTPQELGVLIAACRRAAAPHECVTSDVKTSEPPLGVAIVRREGERAHIELGLRGGSSAEWSTRDLSFQPGDDELERYRAIGFAVGTLVARQVEPPPEPPPNDAAPPPKPPEVVVAAPTKPLVDSPQPAPALRASWLDVAGQVGLGLIPGPPRAGGALRAATELVPRGFFVVAEVGYAQRLGEPELRARWLDFALGVGHPLSPRLRSLGVDVRLCFALERVSVTAQDGERSEGAARWKPGAIAAIDGHWDFSSSAALLVSAATFIDPERTVINSGGQSAGETPALGLGGYLGLRLRLR